MKKTGYYLTSLFFSFGITNAAFAVSMLDYDNETVGTIVEKIISWVLLFAGALAVLFIILAGMQYVTSSGNKEKTEKAKQTLTYAIIGLIIVILARFIVGFIDFNVKNIKDQKVQTETTTTTAPKKK